MNRALISGKLSLFFICCFVFLMDGCDLLKPAEFDSKVYAVPEIDARAVNLLSRPVIKDTLGGVPVTTMCYVVKTRPLWTDTLKQNNLVDSTSRANNTDNQLLHLNYVALVESLSTKILLRDTITAVQLSPHENISYALFEVAAGQPNDIYIYTSQLYKENNINHFVSVQLIKSDTSSVSYTDIMLPEASYAHTEIIEVEGGTKGVSTIRIRYKFHVDTGKYIVRFTTTDIKVIKTFKLLILSI